MCEAAVSNGFELIKEWDGYLNWQGSGGLDRGLSHMSG